MSCSTPTLGRKKKRKRSKKEKPKCEKCDTWHIPTHPCCLPPGKKPSVSTLRKIIKAVAAAKRDAAAEKRKANAEKQKAFAEMRKQKRKVLADKRKAAAAARREQKLGAVHSSVAGRKIRTLPPDMYNDPWKMVTEKGEGGGEKTSAGRPKIREEFVSFTGLLAQVADLPPLRVAKAGRNHVFERGNYPPLTHWDRRAM
jgi:hypothetical protein